MSELINIHDSRTTIRWKLLTSASAFALAVSCSGVAHSEDASTPLIWIELGGQFEQLSGQGGPFTPLFVSNTDWGADKFTSPASVQNIRAFSLSEEASISFQPAGSEWAFSGSLRYGRSSGRKFLHQQTPKLIYHDTLFSFNRYITNYAQTKAAISTEHVIADFQAGKDVGLGMFGSESTSTISAGVRFAQFKTKSDAIIYARPDAHFVQGAISGYPFPLLFYHGYFGSAQRASSFQGVGPSISWQASAPFAGNVQAGEITFDWGVNAAVLFGKQRTKIHYQSSATYRHYQSGGKYILDHLPTHHANTARSRSVAVPNVGGFAGLSFRYSDAKVSFGYRGDFFFGAMDNGFDTRKSDTRGFYGPYASISVGIGD